MQPRVCPNQLDPSPKFPKVLRVISLIFYQAHTKMPQTPYLFHLKTRLPHGTLMRNYVYIVPNK